MKTDTFHATALDMERLQDLLDDVPAHFDGDAETFRELRRKLERVQVVPRSSIDPDVVTLYSEVHIHDTAARDRMRFELVLPEESDFERSQLSVLAPLGAAVFGCRAGSSVQVDAPAGPRRIRILEVVQPPRAEEEQRFVVPWYMEPANQGVLT
jgi:regulator of nucleoside diphosphate kinase